MKGTENCHGFDTVGMAENPKWHKSETEGLSWRPSRNSRQRCTGQGWAWMQKRRKTKVHHKGWCQGWGHLQAADGFPAYHSLCCMLCSISWLLSPSIAVLGQPKPLLLRLLWSPPLCPWVRAAQQSPVQLNLIITLSQFKYFNHATS